MSNANERRHYFPQDTWDGLKFYAADERLRLSEEIRSSLTPQELAWAIINNHLQKMGHYPPKKVDGVEPQHQSTKESTGGEA